MAQLFPEAFETEFVDLSGLEMYNQDLDDEGQPTVAWTAFRNQVKSLEWRCFCIPAI